MSHLTNLLDRTDSIPQTNAAQHTAVALQPDHLRLHEHFDVGERANSRAQILRHRRFERRAAHDHRHLGRLRREIHRGLSRGVTGTDQSRLRCRCTSRRLERRRPVVHAGALEFAEVVDVELGGTAHRVAITTACARMDSPRCKPSTKPGPVGRSALRRASRPRSESPFRRRTSAPGCAHAPSAPCR